MILAKGQETPPFFAELLISLHNLVFNEAAKNKGVMAQNTDISGGRSSGASQDMRRLTSLAQALVLWHGRPPRRTDEAAEAPAISVQDSIQDDFLICLETGARVKLLGRHLRHLGLSMEEYRHKWGLPSDYPCIAPNYAAARAAARAATPQSPGSAGIRSCANQP